MTGLGSRNGTVVKRPAQRETVVVEPPRDDAEAPRSAAVGDAAERVAADCADDAGAADGEKRPLSQPTEPAPIYPGDVIVFGGATAFCVLARPSMEGLFD